ncbi:hypothetical protein ZOSMA_21G00470 [Zostera marina]|uniref:Uncharacterized protein n=1 Tax=Zostera marina TaxID=29655 RepID=A0A0K9PJG5_ZOSMR|nr:hypothetical protein ZOSMA_21G00470 [Zostera marina]
MEEDTPIPIGECIKCSGKGLYKKNHYSGFEVDGNQYELGDSVLLTPDAVAQKPYVAIIRVSLIFSYFSSLLFHGTNNIILRCFMKKL